MNVRIQSSEQLEQAAEALEARGESISNITYTAPTETGESHTEVAQAPLTPDGEANSYARVGRNESCPCGSGKKYKHCHGKLA